ncbi:MAG: hypothetical protein Alpg2KO_34100 [Alphaproteobacteria bacterium]
MPKSKTKIDHSDISRFVTGLAAPDDGLLWKHMPEAGDTRPPNGWNAALIGPAGPCGIHYPWTDFYDPEVRAKLQSRIKQVALRLSRSKHDLLQQWGQQPGLQRYLSPDLNDSPYTDVETCLQFFSGPDWGLHGFGQQPWFEDRNPREPDLTTKLAELLYGNHLQCFVSALCRAAGCPEIELPGSAVIEAERLAANNRRVDLAITWQDGPDTKCILIEAKFGAPLGPKQLERYLRLGNRLVSDPDHLHLFLIQRYIGQQGPWHGVSWQRLLAVWEELAFGAQRLAVMEDMSSGGELQHEIDDQHISLARLRRDLWAKAAPHIFN